MNEVALSVKVVIEQGTLRGTQDGTLQRVATVYINGTEYRVLAPPAAVGGSLEWVDHFEVRQRSGINSEVRITDAYGILALKEVTEELERQKSGDRIASGLTPDGLFCNAQICLQGHVQSCNGRQFNRDEHCSKCGSACIDSCSNCKAPIRGMDAYISAEYVSPAFCHKCGSPYPWMEDRLNTARELLNHDEKLSFDERNELWGLLRYVMSNPMADVGVAKKKLIGIKLQKATEFTRELVLDFMAKFAVESLKS